MIIAESRKTALITGSSGFVGSHLLRHLLRDGWSATVLLRKDSAAPVHHDEPMLDVFRLTGDQSQLDDILAKQQPDIIFHLASLFVAEHHPSQVEELIKANILFGAQLLEAMRVCTTKKLVNAGTSWQHYGDRSYDPVCLYAATKQAFEAILTYYSEARGLESITLKLFDTYGPDDHRKKLFYLLREAARSGSNLAMSPGEQGIQLVYIDDVIEAFLLAAHRLMSSSVPVCETYALNASETTRLQEVVQIYSEMTGSNIDVTWGARPYRYREVMTPWRSGFRLPGWSPKVGLREGIRRTESWYQSREGSQ